MGILPFIAGVALAAWGLALLHSGAKAGHTGPVLAGLCCLAGGIGAIVLASWWPIAIGFGLTWVVRSAVGDPSRQGSALHEAVIAHDPDRAARLLADGADIHAKNHQGQTPLDLAVALNYTEMAQLLSSHAGKAMSEHPPRHETVAEPLTKALPNHRERIRNLDVDQPPGIAERLREVASMRDQDRLIHIRIFDPSEVVRRHAWRAAGSDIDELVGKLIAGIRQKVSQDVRGIGILAVSLVV